MNIFGIGIFELLFSLVVALLVLGPSKMVEAARGLGRFLRDLQRATSELPKLVSLEEEEQSPLPSQRQQLPEQPLEQPQDPPSQGSVPRG